MGKRSQRVAPGLCLAVLVALVTSPKGTTAAYGAGYLSVVGPSPLRYQSVPPAEPQPAAVETRAGPAPAVGPLTVSSEPSPPPAPAPAPEPKALVSPPDVLRSLLFSPLWATMCDGFFGAATGIAVAADNAQARSNEDAPTVTPEMLTEFFKQPEAPVERPVRNEPAAPGNPKPASGLPPAVFVLPSSQAIYRSQ